jgi:hypothetical protein
MAIPAIQGDAAFSAFQSKLATVVVNAPKLGKQVGPGAPRCCCPLGAHPQATSPLPPSAEAQKGGWDEVSLENLRAFIEGWHRNTDFEPAGDSSARPYFLLGGAYRAQFWGALA